MNNFREVISDIDTMINEILNQKEISYDVEIIKSKLETINKRIEEFILLRNSVKEDLKEELITEDEYWEYSNEYSKTIKKMREEKNKLENRLEKLSFESQENIEWLEKMKTMQKVKKLNKIMMDELIEDIVIDNEKNIKIIFKCEDKYFEALDFINRNKCGIISPSENAEKIIAV